MFVIEIIVFEFVGEKKTLFYGNNITLLVVQPFFDEFPE